MNDGYLYLILVMIGVISGAIIALTSVWLGIKFSIRAVEGESKLFVGRPAEIPDETGEI